MCNKDNCPIPYGFCHCGCGAHTNISRSTFAPYDWVKGEPRKFLRGHSTRGRQVHTKAVFDRYSVRSDGCWVWDGEISQSVGYGIVDSRRRGGRREYAHRLYYEHFKGAIPRGLQIDHLCSNRTCVNPDHLEAVTQAENVRRGRGTKITDAEVVEIHRSGMSSEGVAQKYGISAGYATGILRGTNSRVKRLLGTS